MATPDSGTSFSTFPSWAYKVFLKEIYEQDMECEEGADMNFDDLVFVIDGIDYAMPSHHWNQRMIDENLTKGGTCVTSIS